MTKAEQHIDEARSAVERNDQLPAAHAVGLATRAAIAAGRIMVPGAPSALQPSLKEKVERFRLHAKDIFMSIRQEDATKTLNALEGLDDIRDELWNSAAAACGMRRRKKP